MISRMGLSCIGAQRMGQLVGVNGFLYSKDLSSVKVAPIDDCYFRNSSLNKIYFYRDDNYEEYDTLTGLTSVIARGGDEQHFYLNKNTRIYVSGILDQKTKVVCKEEGVIYENLNESLGVLENYNRDYLFFYKDGTNNVLDIRSGIVLWREKVKGSKVPFNDLPYFCTLKVSEDKKESVITKYDYATREVVDTIRFERSFAYYKIDGETVYFLDRKSDGVINKCKLCLVSGKVESEHFLDLKDHEEIDDVNRVRDLDYLLEGKFSSEDEYVFFTRSFVSSKVKPQGPDKVKRYCAKTGAFKGLIKLPEELKLSSFECLSGNRYVATCYLRKVEHGAPHQLFIWDEDEWLNPSDEYHTPPKVIETQRLHDEEGFSFYIVSASEKGERFFDLVCQLSAELYRIGAQYGLHLNSDDKERDREFNGQINCDLSALKLNDLERLAVIQLCDTVTESLNFDYYRTPIDPAEKIKITPVFMNDD